MNLRELRRKTKKRVLTASLLVGAIVIGQPGCTSLVSPVQTVSSGKIAADMLKEQGAFYLPLANKPGDSDKMQYLVADNRDGESSPPIVLTATSETSPVAEEGLGKNEAIKVDSAIVDESEELVTDTAAEQSVPIVDSGKVTENAEPVNDVIAESEPADVDLNAVAADETMVEVTTDEPAANVAKTAIAQETISLPTEHPAGEFQPANDDSPVIASEDVRAPDILRKKSDVFPDEINLQDDEGEEKTAEDSLAVDARTVVAEQPTVEPVDSIEGFQAPSPAISTESDGSELTADDNLQAEQHDSFNIQVIEDETSETVDNDANQPDDSANPVSNHASAHRESGEHPGDFIPPVPVVNAEDADVKVASLRKAASQDDPHVQKAAVIQPADADDVARERQSFPSANDISEPAVLADQAVEKTPPALGSESGNLNSSSTAAIELPDVNHNRLRMAADDNDIPRMFGLGEDSETITEAGFATHFSDGSFSYYPQSGLDALHDSFSFETVRTDSAGKSARWITMVNITHLLATESQAATSAEHESLQSELATEPDVNDDVNSNASKSLAPQATTHGKANAVEKIRVADDKHGVDFSIEQKTLAYPKIAPVLREVNFDLPDGPSLRDNADSPGAQKTE